MKKVDMERVTLEAPLPARHRAMAGEWMLHLYPELEPTPELEEKAAWHFDQNFLTRPNSMFWGVTADGEPIGIFGFFDMDPVNQSAVVFGIGDKDEIQRNHAGLGRNLLEWVLESMVPKYFTTVRAYCKERHVINMMRKAGFEQIDLGDAILEMRG